MANTIASELINMQNTTAQMQAQERKLNGGTKELGEKAFLTLMMEQLKYQDPLEPMDNTQFLTQQAQFTQLSSLQNMEAAMNSYNQYSQAASMMGKDVIIKDPNTEEYVYGNVEAVNLSSKNATVVVGGRTYPLETIVQIQANKVSVENEN